jgi:hypothetical protein
MRTIYIDDSIKEGKAFLNFAKTLKFVVTEDNEITLTDSQKEELNHRKATAKSEDFISLEEANRNLINKYGL